jgi:hypothetical protein
MRFFFFFTQMKELHCKEREEQGSIPHRITPGRKEQGGARDRTHNRKQATS